MQQLQGEGLLILLLQNVCDSVELRFQLIGFRSGLVHGFSELRDLIQYVFRLLVSVCLILSQGRSK